MHILFPCLECYLLPCLLYSFVKVAMAKHHKLHDSHIRNLLFHSSGASKSPDEIKLLANLVLSKQFYLKMGRESEETFFQKRHTMANRCIKRYLTLLFIREKQVKTTMRHHLIFVRMTISKEARNKKCW